MRFRIDDKSLPVLATLVVCLLLYALGSIAFYQNNFLSFQVFELLFSSEAVLGILAVGMTFVILSGGIDLSVGSLLSLSTMIVAMLVANAHWHPLIAMLVALAAGAAGGLINGCLIQFFELPPFLVTLAMLFLARGIALWMNHTNRISLDGHPFFQSFTRLRINVGDVRVYLRTIMLLIVVAAGVIVARTTRFGRAVYAIGGSEQAAVLMGLPVARTKVLVYSLSGLLAGLGGVILLSGSPSGDPTIAVGWELDAIAAVVIGGTLLSGGVGSVFGTLLGTVILALIGQIRANSNRDEAWDRIANGLLLFAFIVLQKLLTQLRVRGMSRLPRKTKSVEWTTGASA